MSVSRMQNNVAPMRSNNSPRPRSNTATRGDYVASPKNPRVKHSAKRLSLPVPSGDTETSPRQCDLCGKVKYTMSAVPPNSPAVNSSIARTCKECASIYYSGVASDAGDAGAAKEPWLPHSVWEDANGVPKDVGAVFIDTFIPFSKGNCDGVVTFVTDK